MFAAEPAIVPLPRAHSHNDYLHPRPLLDALAEGFCSVEADIHLESGALLVAHDRDKTSPGRTLEALYLAPLAERVRTNRGAVYLERTPFFLLIDIKSDAEPTYAALKPVLRGYTNILTAFRPDKIETNAVTVIISGNRPVATMLAESERYAGVDGRIEDLDLNRRPYQMPWISDNWTRLFTWRGDGPFPDPEKTRLHDLAARAHRAGHRLRLWAAPDKPAGWEELYAAGVDFINTDDLPGLRRWFLMRARGQGSPRTDPK